MPYCGHKRGRIEPVIFYDTFFIISSSLLTKQEGIDIYTRGHTDCFSIDVDTKLQWCNVSYNAYLSSQLACTSMG